MRSWTALFLAAYCVCASIDMDVRAQSPASSFRFKHYRQKDGLLNDFADRLKQDSLGFIWIVYYGGVSRFDGYSFKTYRYDVDDTLTHALKPPLGFTVKGTANEIAIPQRRASPGEKRNIVRYDRKADRFVKYEFDLDGVFLNDWQFEPNGSKAWIGSYENGLYSYDFENKKLANYRNRLADGKTSAPPLTVLPLKNYKTHILLGSAGSGLWLFDKKAHIFSRPGCNPRDTALLYHGLIAGIVDKVKTYNDGMWIFTDRYFLQLDSTLSIVKKLRIPAGVNPRSVSCDEDGVFWFPSEWSSNDGLYRYDTRDSSFIKIKNDPADPRSIPSNMVYDVIVDFDQNVWVGTDHGISVLPKRDLAVHNRNVPAGTVWSTLLYKSRGSEYLIVSRSPAPFNRLEIAPVSQSTRGVLDFRPFLPSLDKPVISMHRGIHFLWILPFGGGIVGYPIDPVTGMPKEDHPVKFKHDPQNPNSLSSDVILKVWEDHSGNLWACNMIHGIDRIRLDTPYGASGSVFRYGGKLNGGLYPETQHSFWVMNDSTISLLRIPGEPGEAPELLATVETGQSARVLFKTQDGQIFLGTANGLLSVQKKQTHYELDKTRIINRSEIVSILEDGTGRLWVHANDRMACFDRKDYTVTFFDQGDGIDHMGGIEGLDWMQQTREGILIVSGSYGFSFIDPASFKVNYRKAFPVLTRLKVNNAEFTGTSLTGEPSFSTASDISLLQKLELDYRHNNFAIEFSAMELTSPEKNLYRHKLEGFDADWIETSAKDRTATYTNLDAGDYVFKVRASNHLGIWSDQETTLAIVILPPPWKTWWAYSLYAISLVVLFLYWKKYDNKRLALRHRAEHLSEVDMLKTRFFANISHEFRTPITLLLGPMKEMYDETSDPKQKSVLTVMLRNGQRLLRLINQLLDLSKLEASKMELQSRELDMVMFLRELASCYESMAAEKRIRYFFHAEVPELTLAFDDEKLEKVIHNLLSNAFKFTKPGGEVILSMKVVDRGCVIQVADTGIGIPAHELDKVFDRFYQVDNSQTREFEGSGLGMALSKELVELHGGKINVESKEGKGTVFTVVLPLDTKATDSMPEGRSLPSAHASREVEEATIDQLHEEASAANGQGILLIIEDNSDMRQYMRRVLSPYWNIREAENGREGLRKALEIIPDLIISDVMMPEMDGHQLCRELKDNELTSHIPVILLTAKADRESKLSGLKKGADDYLTKPFDAEELQLIVRNRIEERRRMRDRYSREITLDPQRVAVTSLDEKFLIRVLAIVEAHIQDEHFSIEQFAQDAGYSNIQFYRKIKGLTGKGPSLFLRSVRLKRAADLLSKNSDTVSQIAYSVGFGSVSYFSKCFKEEFGMTPGQFVKQDSQAP